MPAPNTPPPATPEALLETLLDVSLTGIILFRPVYAVDGGGEIVDLAYVRLNLAAQRMLQLPECPPETFLTRYPNATEAGIFAFYRDTFLSGAPGRYDVNYQHDGLDNYFRLAAYRCETLLVVSFTDTADHDRTAVEQALRESQARERASRAEAEAQRQRLHDMIAQAPALIASLAGPTHVVQLANKGFRQLFDNREMVGKTYREAVPELQDQEFFALLDRVYATGETYYGNEVPAYLDQPTHSPRVPRYFNFIYQATRDATGAVAGVLIFAYEVTEQVQARRQVQRLNEELEARVRERTQQLEAALRGAERQGERLNTLFMQAPAPIVILDGPTLVYQLVNPAYQQIFPGRVLLGRPLLEALPELAGTLIPNLLQEVFQTGETRVAQEMPVLLARHEGGPLEEIYWTFTCQPRRDAQGTVDGVLAIAHEVTDQVRARQVVMESEQNFRRMADSAPAMLWVTDPQGYCTYLNAQWYAFTGQSEAEALGIGWTRVVHPDDAPGAEAAFLDACARRIPFHYLYRLRRHDGVYRWAVDSGLPRFSATGEYEGIVGTVIDIHEQKLAEQALQKLTQKLRRARDEAQDLNTELQTTNQHLTRTNVDLDNFIYTASHDLKAPITNIEGLLAVLNDQLAEISLVSADVAPVLGMMYESVARFQRTIDQLSDVTKLQKEHGQPTTEVLLAPVVHDVRQDLQPLLRETAARLDVELNDCVSVSFSAKNLRSVLFNLLSNALKYRHPDRAPHIRLHCHLEPGHTVLTVQDNGLGLTSEQLPELFGMFRRLHSHIEGSGLGLYMVKRSVENAGGKVVVTSKIGEGSAFAVYFPR
ncbi:PAS domain S-box-containing protein [Hymenobacter daecheongensis DSM 21074]|uniref:histidine kinase n=1 Tax=Hymenobacter daecheongensis DSM 21074 TaxID=1121955 RepID=A0A1M6K3W4_9BACT|nr:PAS domain-containing protein [Hymenobacter daecheongensis]SHJ53661.1 PAS domain S-box-containing protein [Hymenobacter daecheongensis DSM 21074]